jgi:hypothetical protein
MNYISLILLIGVIHQEDLNSMVFAFSASLQSFFMFPKTFIANVPKNKSKYLGRIFKILKLSVIPIFVLWLFYIIYKNANPVFDKISFKFIDNLVKFISPFFKNISFLHILFILMGLGFVAWILFKTKLGNIILHQSKMMEALSRKRKKLSEGEKNSVNLLSQKNPAYFRKQYALKMRLKYELISAAVLLVLINLLLLIVNIIDIDWVWIGFKYSDTFDMKQFVHEGTYLLIISILLSMGIMLYFFRSNLNFYRKAKIIKLMTYSWILQNMVLAISVAIRNFRYIDYWGLAYKRVGVILFLIAVIFGLITLFFKIRYTKTAYYLIRRNTLAVFVILMVSCLLNWDSIIAKHNLSHPLKNHMETSYLLSMSDKVLPLIDKHSYILNQDVRFNSYAQFDCSYKEYYRIRVKKFLDDYKKQSWVSWNFKEWKAYKYYTEQLKMGK